jgi:hypothetical protein
MPLDPTATRVEREFRHTSPLLGCRFDPSGRFLFATAQDNTIQRFDIVTGAKTALLGHTGWARGLAFVGPASARPGTVEKLHAISAARGGAIGPAAINIPVPPADPFTLVSADYHGKLIWWDGAAAAPTPIRTVEAHTGWCRAVAVSPDGATLASCGNDGLIKLWDAATGAPRRTLAGHAAHVYNVAFHPSGTRLVSADLMGVVKDWDTTTGACVRDLDAKVMHKYDPTFRADIGGARGMAIAPDGRVACAGITNVSNAFAGVGNPAGGGVRVGRRQAEVAEAEGRLPGHGVGRRVPDRRHRGRRRRRERRPGVVLAGRRREQCPHDHSRGARPRPRRVPDRG